MNHHDLWKIYWNRYSEGPGVAHTGKCLYQDTWITCFLTVCTNCKLRYPKPYRGGPKSNLRMKLRKPKQDLFTRVCPEGKYMHCSLAHIFARTVRMSVKMRHESVRESTHPHSRSSKCLWMSGALNNCKDC